MQRSSDSIAALAAALAKAQIVLTNPEKSLIGSIRPESGNGPERLFRYASLASGLDIVRKTLGHHEIATMQATTIDQPAGIVNLTTVLAHSSGEWISSDWPVCPISETAQPHKMGASLTYARRYALFTLVGIAGEDDLDAPDLIAPASQSPALDRSRPAVNGAGRLDFRQAYVRTHAPTEQSKKRASVPDPPKLDAELSAKLRDEMLKELSQVDSSDEAARWAKRRYPDKNTKLSPADAARVEKRFHAKIINLVNHPPGGFINATTELLASQSSDEPGKPVNTASIDKSSLAFPEPRRVRDREHRRYVAQQSCLVCGRSPSDAHHLRFAQMQALGRKASDEFTVPLCRGHHRELHRFGDEEKWWRKIAIDPMAAARTLWLETHGTTRVAPNPIDSNDQALSQHE